MKIYQVSFGYCGRCYTRLYSTIEKAESGIMTILKDEAKMSENDIKRYSDYGISIIEKEIDTNINIQQYYFHPLTNTKTDKPNESIYY